MVVFLIICPEPKRGAPAFDRIRLRRIRPCELAQQGPGHIFFWNVSAVGLEIVVWGLRAGCGETSSSLVSLQVLEGP